LALSAGVITSLGNVACYEALGAGGKAAAVIPLTSLYPLVTVILALFLLREALNAIQWTGAGISLAALYCFNGAPGAAGLSPWLVIALAPIVLWGVAALLQKISTQHASSELATFAFLLGFLPVGIATPLAHPMEWNLRAGTWALLLLLGLFFALGNLTLMAAYASGGRAAVVTTMASLYSVVTIPLAVLALGESITAREGLGLALALAAVAALSWEGRASAPKVCLDQSDSSL
jgi:transporter family protein